MVIGWLGHCSKLKINTSMKMNVAWYTSSLDVKTNFSITKHQLCDSWSSNHVLRIPRWEVLYVSHLQSKQYPVNIKKIYWVKLFFSKKDFDKDEYKHVNIHTAYNALTLHQDPFYGVFSAKIHPCHTSKRVGVLCERHLAFWVGQVPKIGWNK